METIEKIAVGDIAGRYTVAICYLRQIEFGIKNNISKNAKDLYKPYGELLVSILNLCKECHFYQDFYKDNNFKSGLTWFNQCLKELIKIEISVICSGNELTNHWQKVLRILKNQHTYTNEIESTIFNNPFIQYGSPALSLLIEQSLYMCANNRFKKSKWTPFIKSLENIVKLLTKSKKLSTIVIEDNTLKYSINDKGGRKREKQLPPIFLDEIAKCYL